MALNVMSDGEEEEEAADDDAMEYKDEGYIELVLQVLSRMCDGQFAGLQVSAGPVYTGRMLPFQILGQCWCDADHYHASNK